MMGFILQNKNDLEILFQQYYSVLCKVAHGYVPNNSIVEEIVSDIFIKLWNNRTNIIIKVSIKEYLIKSTRNNCIDYLRSNKKRDKQTAPINDESNTLADLGENPLDYLVNRETEQHILAAIDALPDRYRLTFKLNRIDGLSYDEVAEVMGISKNTVKSNLRDALHILREKLQYMVMLLLLFIDS